ncbi:unnamed protein product [Amoebophrya sp. A120]|nr:unnamed protein product [Amoebophrya sp. A120]|eukprot:GSA120T00008246001.1
MPRVPDRDIRSLSCYQNTKELRLFTIFGLQSPQGKKLNGEVCRVLGFEEGPSGEKRLKCDIAIDRKPATPQKHSTSASSTAPASTNAASDSTATSGNKKKNSKSKDKKQSTTTQNDDPPSRTSNAKPTSGGAETERTKNNTDEDDEDPSATSTSLFYYFSVAKEGPHRKMLKIENLAPAHPVNHLEFLTEQYDVYVCLADFFSFLGDQKTFTGERLVKMLATPKWCDCGKNLSFFCEKSLGNYKFRDESSVSSSAATAADPGATFFEDKTASEIAGEIASDLLIDNNKPVFVLSPTYLDRYIGPDAPLLSPQRCTRAKKLLLEVEELLSPSALPTGAAAGNKAASRTSTDPSKPATFRRYEANWFNLSLTRPDLFDLYVVREGALLDKKLITLFDEEGLRLWYDYAEEFVRKEQGEKGLKLLYEDCLPDQDPNIDLALELDHDNASSSPSPSAAASSSSATGRSAAAAGGATGGEQEGAEIVAAEDKKQGGKTTRTATTGNKKNPSSKIAGTLGEKIVTLAKKLTIREIVTDYDLAGFSYSYTGWARSIGEVSPHDPVSRVRPRVEYGAKEYAPKGRYPPGIWMCGALLGYPFISSLFLTLLPSAGMFDISRTQRSTFLHGLWRRPHGKMSAIMEIGVSEIAEIETLPMEQRMEKMAQIAHDSDPNARPMKFEFLRLDEPFAKVMEGAFQTVTESLASSAKGEKAPADPEEDEEVD